MEGGISTCMHARGGLLLLFLPLTTR